MLITTSSPGIGEQVTRSATYVIAASDAPASWLSQSDEVLDGVADDVQINAALVLYYSVLLSPGTFNTIAKISCPSNRRLFGCGIGITNIVGSGAGTHYQIIGNTTQSGAGNSNIYISDMSIDAAWVTGDKTALHGALCLAYVTDVLVERVKVENGKQHNFELVAAVNVTLRDCVSLNPVGDDGFSVSEYGLGAVSVSRNVYHINCESSGVPIVGDADFEVDDGPQYVWFQNCYAHSTGMTGFSVKVHSTGLNPAHIYFTNNRVDGTGWGYFLGTQDVNFGTVISDVKVIGGSIANITEYAIVLDSISGVEIGDVTFTGNARGIECRSHLATNAALYNSRITVRDCSFATTNTDASFKDTDDVKFSGNTITGTGSHNYLVILEADGRDISGAQVINNTVKNATYIGLYLKTEAGFNMDNFLIEGNEIFDDQGVPTQDYGLDLHSIGSMSNGQIRNNNFHGNTVTNVLFQGAGTYSNMVYSGNRGYCAPGEIRSVYGDLVKTGTKLTNGTGVLTESGVYLKPGVNTLNITGAGTFTVTLPAGTTGTAASGTATLAGSPVTLANGTVLDSGATTGTITVTLTCIAFAWHDPETYDVLIKKVVVYIQTKGGTATSLIDVGIADDAIGTNKGTEFFNDIDADAAAITHDSWLPGGVDFGTQTKWVLLQDTLNAIDGWIVGSILTEKADGLVGKYYIEYVGR